MKRITALAISGLMACSMIFPFAACNFETGTPEEPHEHTYSKAWSTSETQHWHAATCGHNVDADRADHTFTEDECTVCGYKRGDEPDPGPDQPVKPNPENPDATVEVTVGIRAGQAEENLMTEWINGFTDKYPNVNVKITQQLQGMPDLTLWRTGGIMPDIVWTAGDQHSPYSGPDGKYFQDLSDDSKFPGNKEFFSGFYESLIESTHYSTTDTGIWFVPRDYNRLVIYINETAFEQMNVPVPDDDWTWEEFIDTCVALKAAKAQKAIAWRKWRPVYTTMVTNFGAKYIESDGVTLAINSPEMKKCYEFYEYFYLSNSEVEPGMPKEAGLAIADEGPMFTNYSAGDSVPEGTVPMIVDVRPQLPMYMQAAYNGDWKLTTRAFPNYIQPDGSEGYVGAGCSGYGITTECTDPETLEWAWKFLQYCMSEEGYNSVAYLGDLVPALKSMRDSGEWRDYSYRGNSVNPDAFVASNTKDIFLNYHNPVENGKQDAFIRLIDDFWKNCGSVMFEKAVDDIGRKFAGLLAS